MSTDTDFVIDLPYLHIAAQNHRGFVASYCHIYLLVLEEPFVDDLRTRHEVFHRSYLFQPLSGA